MKNVVVYWCGFRGRKDNYLSFLGSKKKVYLDVFDRISKKANLYLAFGEENYLGNMKFKNYYLYDGGQFIKKNKPLLADSVLDRSRTLSFPEESKLTDLKVLNQLAFKELAIDKWLFYQRFKKYSPETILCNDYQEIKQAAFNIDGNLVVVKPRLGLKGEGIFIGEKKRIPMSGLEFPVLMQEFVETDGFLEGIRRHDIRVVIINGKPVYSVLRRPVRSEYLANVAQGGSIEQVSLNGLPKEILRISKKIAVEIKEEYSNPFYSIDFGLTKNGPIIFELNSFIGFPRIEREHDLFVSELSRSLIDKANISL